MKTIFEKSFLLLSVLSIVSCAGKPGQTAEVQDEERASLVEVNNAGYAQVPQTETYSSTIQAYTINNVVPQTGNRIAKINVEVGDFVSAGQVLAEMDRANLTQTELKLANDSTELSRLKELFYQGGISQSDYETAEMAYKISRTSYDNMLENTILRSPINGVVTARNYDKGDMYAMTSPIYVVQQISPVKVLVGVSEKDYTRVHKGDKVEIEVDAIPGKKFEGSVNRIYPTIDPASHTFTIEVVVPNSNRELRPGMYARVTMTFAVNRNIVIPDTGLNKLQGSGVKTVFVVNPDNTVSTKVVTPGRHFDGKYEILDGLQEGDIVVVKGQNALKEGSKVTY